MTPRSGSFWRARVAPLASLILLLSLSVTLAEPGPDGMLRLQMPVKCDLDRDCFIQNFVDRAVGEDAMDFTCGAQTYDGHDGTDFRVPDLAPSRNVDVLAAAPGRVLRVRNRMPDISVLKIGEEAVSGKECGNGVVIDHGGGWQTQYCHLARNSVMVEPGTEVAAGQPIGRIGMSGLSELPHVHFSVSYQGDWIDPFAFGSEPGGCGGGEVLWDFAATWEYETDFIINTGFAADKVTIDDINWGALQGFVFKADAPILLAAGLAGGLSEGTMLTLSLSGPDGEILAEKTVGPLDAPMAQYYIGVGKRRPASGWPEGIYTAVMSLSDGETVREKRFEVER
ncbi:MAG: M23 family metallopeptidase [Hyphomicrobiales bacterium]|nr:M23 family metallopeptidase [Hyphomicrobiales bacterium]